MGSDIHYFGSGPSRLSRPTSSSHALLTSFHTRDFIGLLRTEKRVTIKGHRVILNESRTAVTADESQIPLTFLSKEAETVVNRALQPPSDVI